MRKLREQNQRKKVCYRIVAAVILITLVCIAGELSAEVAMVTDFSRKDQSPSLSYLFGTDWLGRDMFFRTLKGISTSVTLGMLAALCSAIIAVILGTASAIFGKPVDKVVCFLIDLVMGIPHVLLLIMISVALGRGMRGVTIGVALTHWPILARLVRAEVIQLKESPYIQLAEKLGKSKWYLAKTHMFPHLLPQFIVGLILLFPHAILHEASISFLGFGLASGQAAVGVILSEAMKYIVTGKWWLAVFPGVMLLGLTVLIYKIGDGVRQLTNPYRAQE